MSQKLVKLATLHPFKTIVTIAFLTGLSLLLVRRLELGGSIYDLFPRRSGPIADLAHYTRTFGSQDELVVLLNGNDAVRVEKAGRAFAEKLAHSPFIKRVSLGVEGPVMAEFLRRHLLLLVPSELWPQIQNRLTSGLEQHVLRLRRMLLAPVTPHRSWLVEDPLLLSEILTKQFAMGVSQKNGLYQSSDGKALLLLVEPREPSSNLDFCRQLQHELNQLGAMTRAIDSSIQVQFTGGHMYAAEMSRVLQHDLTVSSLLALAGVALIQFFFFRSLRLIPLSALVAGVALSWTLAVAVLTVGHLNALSLAFAALFIGMSDDALIHITAHTRQFTALSPALRFQRALARVTPALLAATLTAAAAFASFALSSFSGLVHMGLLAACGLGMNVLLAFTFFPAMGTLLPPKPGPSGTTWIDRSLERLSQMAQNYRLFTLAVALLLVVVAALMVGRLSFSQDLSRLVPENLAPARTDQAIAHHFERHRDRFIILLQGPRLEEVLQANESVTAVLQAQRHKGVVAEYASISSLLPSNAAQKARLRQLASLKPEQIQSHFRRALASAELDPQAFIPGMQALLNPQPLGVNDLPPALRPLVNRQLVQRQSGVELATIFYLKPNLAPDNVITSLEALVTSLPQDVKLNITGATLAGANLALFLKRDLVLISVVTLLLVTLLLALLVRRLWPVLATIISLLWAGILFAGCLRLLHLSFDVYNVMVLPIIIGYGVDDHLYLMHPSLKNGIRCGMTESGRPVLVATLSTIAAFGALAFCTIPGLRTLGLTGVIGLCLGLIASLVIMPALLALSPIYRTTTIDLE